MEPKEQLLAALRSRVNEGAWSWLREAIGIAERGAVDDLLTVYTAASQRMGAARLDAGDLPPAGVRLERWTVEDAARAVLLLSRAEALGDSVDFVNAALACYEQGDAREQQSWLRAVGALPGSERFLAAVIDACRTSIQPLFEAVACENPYPALFFPDRNFNQMILKALFNGVPLARVVGLAGRLNSELSRMAADYAAERRAAGRSIPNDIALAMSSAGGPGAVADEDI